MYGQANVARIHIVHMTDCCLDLGLRFESVTRPRKLPDIRPHESRLLIVENGADSVRERLPLARPVPKQRVVVRDFCHAGYLTDSQRYRAVQIHHGEQSDQEESETGHDSQMHRYKARRFQERQVYPLSVEEEHFVTYLIILTQWNRNL